MKRLENENYYDVEHEKDVYMKAFLSNISLRDSCTSCKFKKENRVSDITLADFWGINYIKPEMNDEKGTSLVIFFEDINKKSFDEVVKKYVPKPSIAKKVLRKVKRIIKKIIKK